MSDKKQDTKLAEALAKVEASLKKLADINPDYADKIVRASQTVGKVKAASLKAPELKEVQIWQKDGRIFVVGPKIWGGAGHHHLNRLKAIEGHEYDGQQFTPPKGTPKDKQKEMWANPLTRLRSFDESAADALHAALGISYPNAKIVDEQGKDTGNRLPNTPYVPQKKAAEATA